MLGKLISFLAVTSLFAGCHLSGASPSRELAAGIAHVKLNHSTDDKAPIPLGDRLTIVNLFDEFAPGCPTGNRFETMERLNSLRPAGITILVIFSDKHFSAQDLENFKAILPMADSLDRGDIEPIRPHLTEGKLLIVLDAKGNIIWHEKPNTSEQEVFSELSRLINAMSNKV